MNQKTPVNFFLVFLLFAMPLGASASTSFTFITDAQTVPPNTVSGAITVNASAAVTQTTCLLVSSNSSTGQFSSSASSWVPVSAVTMSKNTSNRTFYYMDSTEGSYTITVKIAPKPDSVSASCTNWSEAASNIQSTITQVIAIGSAGSQTQTTTTTSSSTPTQTQTQSQNQASGAGPPALTVLITTDARSMAGGGSYFSAAAYGAEGAPIFNSVRFMWNFGDGSTAEGARVFHVFAYPGRYVVSVTSSYNYSVGIDRIVVEAVQAAVSLEAPGDGSLTIFNKSSKEINIGLWSLVDGGKSYAIPEGTIVLAGEGVRFASIITGLGGTPSAILLYPNSAPAAAATVSADSPLRGERVTAKQPPAVSTPPAKNTAGEVLGISTSTPAPANNKTSPSLWLSLGALTVLLAGGVAGVWYLGRKSGGETSFSVEGFDIE